MLQLRLNPFEGFEVLAFWLGAGFGAFAEYVLTH